MSIFSRTTFTSSVSAIALLGFAACSDNGSVAETAEDTPAATQTQAAVNPDAWPQLSPPALDPEVEARVEAIMATMTLEQKVGQVIQADTNSITPEEVRAYRLGSVLSGGNSAPGDEPYADAAAWLAAADDYYNASLDVEGVEIAIPIIWGIDAVHGHANLSGATVFPHNIGLGAANDPGLIEEIMEVTAAELIVSGHDWTFAPTLAVPRDDRWGRTYEGFSEHPDITAAYGAAIVFGLQGRPGTDTFFDDTSVISSAKHFVGDGGTTNGVDQGDTAISEADMRDIHAPGYFPAIDAGVQTIMASFNSWNGVKMHGYEAMLTDVLKSRMGFTGFVIGDWNGHGQIPGCTNTDCPESLIAGVDMYMAPDSWKGVYASTLAAAQSGELPMERLDEAVRRILRVKVTAGLFEKPAPSARPGAGDLSLLGSDAHRDVARRAVRQSMVLLKNNDAVLPLDAGATVLVIGDGADSITKQAGGWTLSWQGGGYANADFPNGQSILSGIEEAVTAGGGTVIFDEDGVLDEDVAADVVIAIYGEDPYAEFQGDLDHLDWEPNGFDPAVLNGFGDTPVVSVFLSGRPLWVNPELNASDAFVAAWLPGTEGGGIADVLFQTEPDYGFTGRLSYSWPATADQFSLNTGDDDYAPLFAYGYGLSYGATVENLPQLSEDNGLEEGAFDGDRGVFQRGGAIKPWTVFLMSQAESVVFNGSSANIPGLAAGRVDHLAQEDGLSLAFSADGAGIAFIPDGASVDWSSAVDEGKMLGFAVQSDADVTLTVSMVCAEGTTDCAAPQTVDVSAGQWNEYRVPAACLVTGDASAMTTPLMLAAPAGARIGLADIRIVEPTSTSVSPCTD